MPPIRVVLVDDHQLFRAGIRALLERIRDFEVVAEAGDGHEGLGVIDAYRPDVVLMDVEMPGLNGLDATAQVVRRFPGTRVIILSLHQGGDAVIRTLRAGAAGYLVKTAAPAELEIAIRAVARGETFLSSVVSRHVVDGCIGGTPTELTSLERLTPRQREVLQLVAEGHTTKEIAERLGIGPKTAETYRSEMMAALGIHEVASLTRYAIRMGIVSADT